jgi:hypothetical protein
MEVVKETDERCSSRSQQRKGGDGKNKDDDQMWFPACSSLFVLIAFTQDISTRISRSETAVYFRTFITSSLTVHTYNRITTVVIDNRDLLLIHSRHHSPLWSAGWREEKFMFSASLIVSVWLVYFVSWARCLLSDMTPDHELSCHLLLFFCFWHFRAEIRRSFLTAFTPFPLN